MAELDSLCASRTSNVRLEAGDKKKRLPRYANKQLRFIYSNLMTFCDITLGGFIEFLVKRVKN